MLVIRSSAPDMHSVSLSLQHTSSAPISHSCGVYSFPSYPYSHLSCNKTFTLPAVEGLFPNNCFCDLKVGFWSLDSPYQPSPPGGASFYPWNSWIPYLNLDLCLEHIFHPETAAAVSSLASQDGQSDKSHNSCICESLLLSAFLPGVLHEFFHWILTVALVSPSTILKIRKLTLRKGMPLHSTD